MSRLHDMVVEANTIAAYYQMLEMRQRLNPHHPLEDREREEHRLNAEMVPRVLKLKELYAEHKDELKQELAALPDNDDIRKSAISLLKTLEICISDDLESVMLTDTDHTSP